VFQLSPACIYQSPCVHQAFRLWLSQSRSSPSSNNQRVDDQKATQQRLLRLKVCGLLANLMACIVLSGCLPVEMTAAAAYIIAAYL
jgi:hypothetical protein